MPQKTSSEERLEQGVAPSEAEESAAEVPAPGGAGDTNASGSSPTGDHKRSRRSKKSSSWVSKATEIPVLIVLAFVIAVVIKTFLVQAFFIPSGSMNPTLRVGDRVLVEKVGYRISNPDRGQIVVFERDVFDGGVEEEVGLVDRARITIRELLGLPTGRQEDYIKRIVAVGGDTVRYARSPRRLIVNGDAVDQSYVRGGEDLGSPTLTGRDCRRLEMERVGGACRVPAGMVFVMGDNRSNSEDSRVLGPIPEDKIVGRAFTIIWPLGNIGRL